MILKGVLYPLWGLVEMLIDFFPEQVAGVFDFVAGANFFAIGLYFLPSGFWSRFLSIVLFWMGAYLTWIVVEWVYKKIPGVS